MIKLKNKKVLLVGLGILGGGLSTAQFLLSRGARLKITDLRSYGELKDTIKELPGDTEFTLGSHSEKDFEDSDIIIFNPAVSALSPWVKMAKEYKKPYFNDYTLFIAALSETNPEAKIIGITGTRGKTTTSLWISHLVDNSTLGGNIPEKGLLKILEEKTELFVLELSSYQLEHVKTKTPSPHIAVFTNLYNDHLNRYGDMETYALFKFKIFENQTKKDFLILNLDEEITSQIINNNPRAQIKMVSDTKLPDHFDGIYFEAETFWYKSKDRIQKIAKTGNLARHERANLMQAMMAAHLAGTGWDRITRGIKDLPSAPLRQEVILRNARYLAINDSAGTSPDATVAAIEKFSKEEGLILITGGTDKNLSYKTLARKISRSLNPERLFLLSGSGTEKLKSEFKNLGYRVEGLESNSLEDLVCAVSEKFKSGTVVFSPGGSSFELFKNEFDRGKKFTNLAKKHFTKLA